MGYRSVGLHYDGLMSLFDDLIRPRALVGTGDQHHGLKTIDGKNPSHFEVAGIDGVWHTADETWIVYGDHIIVRNMMVKEPNHVRMTKPNVVNEAGQTAQPFSTR